MNKIISIFSIISIFFLASGCYYNNEEVLYYPAMPGECDTTSVTYAATIAPIMSDYCISCHGGNKTEKGIDLTTYAGVSKNINRVYGSMSHTKGEPMPPNSKLNDCSINKVKAWQDNGMPQ